jgi:hypothetical protein
MIFSHAQVFNAEENGGLHNLIVTRQAKKKEGSDTGGRKSAKAGSIMLTRKRKTASQL